MRLSQKVASLFLIYFTILNAFGSKSPFER